MSEINIDAETLRRGAATLSHTEEKMVEISNGCICCTLREDLMIEISKLAKEGRFDALLIESTGVSLSFIAQIDCMVTLVDTPHFSADSCSQKHLKDFKQQLHNEDERTIVDLLTEQIEFANIIAIHKIDFISKIY